MTSELKQAVELLSAYSTSLRGTLDRDADVIDECIAIVKAVPPSEAVGLLRDVERIFTAAYNDEEVGTMLNLSGTIDRIRRFLAAQEGT